MGGRNKKTFKLIGIMCVATSLSVATRAVPQQNITQLKMVNVLEPINPRVAL